MMYRVTGEQLTGIANAIRAKTGSSEQIAFPDGFEEQIGTLTDTSDADITAKDVREGKHAYGSDGEKITGTYTPRIANSTASPQRTKTFTVPARSYAKGHLFYMITRPSNEIWSSSMVAPSVTGVMSTGAEVVIVDSYNTMEVVAKGNITVPNSVTWTLKYRPNFAVTFE